MALGEEDPIFYPSICTLDNYAIHIIPSKPLSTHAFRELGDPHQLSYTIQSHCLHNFHYYFPNVH